MDIISCDKFWDYLINGFNFTGGQNSIFPQKTQVAVITVLRYRTAYDKLEMKVESVTNQNCKIFNLSGLSLF